MQRRRMAAVAAGLRRRRMDRLHCRASPGVAKMLRTCGHGDMGTVKTWGACEKCVSNNDEVCVWDAVEVTGPAGAG